MKEKISNDLTQGLSLTSAKNNLAKASTLTSAKNNLAKASTMEELADSLLGNEQPAYNSEPVGPDPEAKIGSRIFISDESYDEVCQNDSDEEVQQNVNKSYREVKITPLSFGFSVKVGCQTIAVETPETLVNALSAYLDNPRQFERDWNKDSDKLRKFRKK